MIVTKKALPRRTFLRGLGTTLALPLLDSMVPALTAAAASAAPRRFSVAYVAHGACVGTWEPEKIGTETEKES